jgi:hypothetical protein
MRNASPTTALVAGLLALLAFGWTDSDRARHVVAEAETAASLPEDLCNPPERCQMAQDGYTTHWISRTGSGNLYLVLPTDCRASGHCGAWFVERTARGVATRLNLEGEFRVLNSGQPVPDVQVVRALSESEAEVTRYTWKFSTFVASETRHVYRVDGEECGTALECYQKAQAAHQNRHTDKALKIWEKVHNLSFI